MKHLKYFEPMFDIRMFFASTNGYEEIGSPVGRD